MRSRKFFNQKIEKLSKRNQELLNRINARKLKLKTAEKAKMHTWASFKSSKNHSLSNAPLQETKNNQLPVHFCIETRSVETKNPLLQSDFSQIERNLNKSTAFFEDWLSQFQKSQLQKYNRIFANLKKRIVGFFKKDVDVN